MKSIVFLLTLALAACSSSSTFVDAPKGQPTRGRVLIAPDDDYADLIPELEELLHHHGFSTVTSEPADYTSSIYVGGGFRMTATVSIKGRNGTWASGSATNPGFGVWLAHGVVRRSLYSTALKKLEGQLDKL